MGTPAEDDWQPNWQGWKDEDYDRAASIVANPEKYPDVSPGHIQKLRGAIDQFDAQREPLQQENAPAPAPQGPPKVTELRPQKIEGEAPRMSRGEAYSVGSRNPFEFGDEMVGYGYDFLGDLFDENDFERKLTRDINNTHDLDPRDDYQVARDAERELQDAADRDQNLAYRGGQMVTEQIATAPLMATPFAAARAVPAATLAARATPTAAEFFAGGAAGAAPWGALTGAGASEEEDLEGLGFAGDVAAGANTAAAFGGTLGTVVGKTLARGSNPARAARLDDEAAKLGKQADRARMEAVGGTGQAYKQVAKRVGKDPERRIADAAERLHPSDDAQSFRDYAGRAREAKPELGARVKEHTSNMHDELQGDKGFVDMDDFFAQLDAAVPPSSGYSAQDKKAQRAMAMVEGIRMKYEPYRQRLSVNDLTAIKRNMDRIGYPDPTLKGTRRGDEQEFSRDVGRIVRQALDDNSQYALPETREGYRAANRDFADNEMIYELADSAAIRAEAKPQYGPKPQPRDQNPSGIESPGFWSYLHSPLESVAKAGSRAVINKGLNASRSLYPMVDRSADAQANLLRGAQLDASGEAALQRAPRNKALGAGGAMTAGFGAATGPAGERLGEINEYEANRPGKEAQLMDAVELALEYSPEQLGAYGDRLQEAKARGEDALAVELHKLSADKTWRTEVRPQLTR